MTPPPDATSENPSRMENNADDAVALPPLVARSAVGGVLMGLANLVPGISGGTMLLAAGVYPRFIAAIGEVTTFRFRKPSVVVLGTVVVAALLSIVLLAGAVKELVIDYRWVMYSLFIGLTLGGVPVVWRLIRNGSDGEHRRRAVTGGVWVAASCGFAGMAVLASAQSLGAAGEGSNDGFAFMLLAGIAGAAAMILPGVSGGYLLLVLGVYVPILAGIDTFKDALSTRDTDALLDVGLAVILPVGLGVLIGVVGVSNLLRWLLRRYELATLGVLLGLLLGAVVGLWPFQKGITPQEGQLIKGQPVTFATPASVDGEPASTQPVWVFVDSLESVEPEDLPTEFFTPTALQAAGSVGLILLGFAVTMGVDRLGRAKPGKTTT